MLGELAYREREREREQENRPNATRHIHALTFLKERVLDAPPIKLTPSSLDAGSSLWMVRWRVKIRRLDVSVKKYINIPSEKYIYVHIYVYICVYTYLCKMDEYRSHTILS